ncbi:BASS family bile acid:Na+ symporter [Catalinimonas alkaloidigena]|uniref:bile acid:sodium symporter family protein n=1 Tax=Catalinimonas alkaloidigena TaxID=1075417 RepID=UPI002406425F|nr:bile acid:sodium symporter family protein [Catalinimonas alkaloidigena]MDF9800539.1 BASS family bile acid:Na+ symporter [Catalinimonas alkaloidigena]
MEILDEIQLNFNQDSLLLLNICMGLVMFGVAIELTVADFKNLWQKPKSLIIGLVAQFLILPLLTYVLVLLSNPIPSVALGMILVACCSGGNLSNMLSVMAGGNGALSVSLTAIATLAAVVATPANFALWGNLYLSSGVSLPQISISFSDMLETILLIVGVPLLLGMLFNHYFPKLTAKIRRPIRIISIVIFGAFIIGAFAANFNIFLEYIHFIVMIVLLHNALAYGGGYSLGQLFGLSLPDKKAITLETGIQNSGIALVLIFNFFDGVGGMAIIAGWWGIWDIISGLALAWGLSKVKKGISTEQVVS